MGVFSKEEGFCLHMIIYKKQNPRDQFVLDSVNGRQNRSGSIWNGSMETVPEWFCSINKL